MRPKSRWRRGQALIFMTMSLIFLFAMTGLSVDLGWAYYLKSRVQTAADAAASAAAVYAKYRFDTCATVSCGVVYTCAGVNPPTTSLQAGCLYATADSPPSINATMVENNTVPPGVSGNAPAMWIRATASTTAHNFFLFGSGFTTATIAAQATAGLTTVPAASCVYILHPTASGALTSGGSSQLTATGCGVYVNSSSATALKMTGSSRITASALQVVGGTSIGGSASASPTATTGAPAITDPFATLPAPTFSGCNQTNYSISGGSATLSPGVFCGGISISSGATVTLNSGIYILDGGGLSVSNSSQLTGSNVMFYNTATGSHTIAPISLTGSSVTTLTAPASGTYRGVVFFQDRNLTYATANSVSGTADITGTYYFPTTSFSYSGNSSTAVKAAFVVNTLSMGGNSSIEQDGVGGVTGLARTTATLIQ